MIVRIFQLMLMLTLGMMLTACKDPPVERLPMDSVQHGYRGTGMVQIYNPTSIEANAEKNAPPFALPAGDNSGPKASAVYKNVKLLGDLSVGQFTRLMVSMTSSTCLPVA